jgi:hypothetical protein
MIKPTASTAKKHERYSHVWTLIKENGVAELTVHIKNQSAVEYGVISTKCDENVARVRVGLPRYAKLIIKRQQISDELVKLSFALAYHPKNI